ncbi:MAG TPA: divalent-cation tolerance protein CutA [Nitrososphaera sp.]|jgi:periplasmic divalent cation tolerance protein|nr:divalent-cation tolerance protein CutA [Nitrososphaera sp.]
MAGIGVIILSTFPSEELAAEVAKYVVGAKLCACVNFTQIRSIYSWNGQIEDQHELIALFKATSKSAKKLKAEIARLHPYEVPEIVELKMSNVSKSYLSWLIAESTYRVAKKRHNTSK